MQKFICVVLGLLILITSTLHAQTKIKQSRILFLLDASSSMSLPWGTTQKRFDVATNILLRTIDSIYAINNEVEFAIRAYGTQHPAQEKNCTDTELEVPFNFQNVDQIKTRLKYLKPIGFSPIAYSLQQAAKNELSNAVNYDYSIIFITDGGESCQGDICKTFAEFILNKIKVTPFIIGLDKNDQLQSYYACMGNYVEVTTSKGIEDAINMIVNANRILLDKPKTRKLETIFSNTKIIKDTAKAIIIEPSIKKEINKLDLIALLMPKYSVSKKDHVRLNNIQNIRLLKSKLKLNFNFEEEAKPLAIERNKKILSLLQTPIYQKKSAQQKTLKTKIVSLAKNPRIKLDFTFEEVIQKSKIEMRNMNVIAIRESEISRPLLFGKKVNLKKKSNISIKFDLPSERINEDLSPLQLATFKNISSKKATPKGKLVSLKKPSRINIAFSFPSERDSTTLKNLIFKELIVAKQQMAILKGRAIVLRPTKVNMKFDIDLPKKDELVRIKPTILPMKAFAYQIPSANKKLKLFPTYSLRFKFDAPKQIVKKDTIKKKLEPQLNSGDLEFNIETENSNETLVQVFFKGVNGKTYPKSTPRIIVNDAKTNQKITSFNREMLNGEPVPQKLEAGVYTFILPGFNYLYANKVIIEANKNNRIYIKVQEATLQFSYLGNRNRVMNLQARVVKRFTNESVTYQKASDKLPYEPGTYYVEVNTMPVSKYSVDLTFGALYELAIPEDGVVEFTNTNVLGLIKIQCALGDNFATFLEMNIKGNASKQKLNLLPGVYKAIIPINPKMPQAGSKAVDFKVKSNETISIELQ
jgi:hypothetical protein